MEPPDTCAQKLATFVLKPSTLVIVLETIDDVLEPVGSRTTLTSLFLR